MPPTKQSPVTEPKVQQLGIRFPEFSSCKNQVSGKKKKPSSRPHCPHRALQVSGTCAGGCLGAHAAPAAFLLHSQAICWPSRARRMKWEGKLRAVTQFPPLLSEVDFDASAHTGAARGWGMEELARGRHRASLANSMHAACAAPPAFLGHPPPILEAPLCPSTPRLGHFPTSGSPEPAAWGQPRAHQLLPETGEQKGRALPWHTRGRARHLLAGKEGKPARRSPGRKLLCPGTPVEKPVGAAGSRP